jgi:crotonobetainyl-CoA:carnitine CoA-transferase CaiB-like acyl-CoA transferase
VPDQSDSGQRDSRAAAPGALDPYRILDLTTDRAWLTGRLLADLGAHVTKIEPPGGDRGRLRGPYADDDASPENNLAWWAYNQGKRSVTLELGCADGRELFLQLVAGADAVLESFTPGQLERWGLGYDELARVNPRIVLTSVTPFGQTGPFAQFAANDLIIAALGGPVWMAGDVDRPPVRTSTPQYFQHAAVEAAVHTVAALSHADQTGEGQRIDVSAQLATMRTLMNALAGPHTDGSVMQRSTFGEASAVSPFRQIFPASDGHVIGAVGFGGGLKGYIQWLRDESTVPDYLEELTEEQLDNKALGTYPPELAARICDTLDEFFAKLSKEEIAEQALRYRLMLVPVNNAGDLTRDSQLLFREYFRPVEHEGRGKVMYPRRWVHLHKTPVLDTPRAPHIGEHNNQVWLDELGLPREQLLLLQQAGTI